jgi:hypothetical protein
MATRILTGGAEAFDPLTAVYLVDTPVGNGADNKRITDVQLVQLFLREFYEKQPILFKKLPKPAGRSEPAISLDGKVGLQTIAGITEFQKFVIQQGGSGAFVDGRVSVPTGFRVAGSRHIFTIIQLNFAFFNDPANKAFNDNLEDHPVVKASLPELAADLGSLRT